MPRVPLSTAILIALVLTTAGVGAVSSTISLFSPAPTVSVGSSTTIDATNTSSGQTIHLFAGTAKEGQTTVNIPGVGNVTLPVGGHVFDAGFATSGSGGTLSINASVPQDKTLVGEKITWVAVVVDNATGKVVAIARAGGPIIEDAIC